MSTSIIPLSTAYLCANCEMVTDRQACAHCGSRATLRLASTLGLLEKARAISTDDVQLEAMKNA